MTLFHYHSSPKFAVVTNLTFYILIYITTTKLYETAVLWVILCPAILERNNFKCLDVPNPNYVFIPSIFKIKIKISILHSGPRYAPRIMPEWESISNCKGSKSILISMKDGRCNTHQCQKSHIYIWYNYLIRNRQTSVHSNKICLFLKEITISSQTDV